MPEALQTSRFFYRLLCSFIFSILFAIIACAAPLGAQAMPVVVDQNTGRVNLALAADYLLDPKMEMSINDVTSTSRINQFSPLQSGLPLHSTGSLWLRFSLVRNNLSENNADSLLKLIPGTKAYTPDATIFIEDKNYVRIAQRKWNKILPEDDGSFTLPQPGQLPLTVYVKFEAIPSLWFNPYIEISSFDVIEAMPVKQLFDISENLNALLAIILVSALFLSLLRGIFAGEEWRFWAAAIMVCALVYVFFSTTLVNKNSFYLTALPTLLAPGFAIMLMPHLGRHIYQALGTKCSKGIDGLLTTLSLLGVLAALLPLIPGFSWSARLLPLAPLLLIPLFLVSFTASIKRLCGSGLFLSACFFPIAGAAAAAISIFSPLPLVSTLHIPAEELSGIGYALGALVIALGRVGKKAEKTDFFPLDTYLNESPEMALLFQEENKLTAEFAGLAPLATDSDSQAESVADSLLNYVTDDINDKNTLSAEGSGQYLDRLNSEQAQPGMEQVASNVVNATAGNSTADTAASSATARAESAPKLQEAYVTRASENTSRGVMGAKPEAVKHVMDQPEPPVEPEPVLYSVDGYNFTQPDANDSVNAVTGAADSNPVNLPFGMSVDLPNVGPAELERAIAQVNSAREQANELVNAATPEASNRQATAGHNVNQKVETGALPGTGAANNSATGIAAKASHQNIVRVRSKSTGKTTVITRPTTQNEATGKPVQSTQANQRHVLPEQNTHANVHSATAGTNSSPQKTTGGEIKSGTTVPVRMTATSNKASITLPANKKVEAAAAQKAAMPIASTPKAKLPEPLEDPAQNSAKEEYAAASKQDAAPLQKAAPAPQVAETVTQQGDIEKAQTTEQEASAHEVTVPVASPVASLPEISALEPAEQKADPVAAELIPTASQQDSEAEKPAVDTAGGVKASAALITAATNAAPELAAPAETRTQPEDLKEQMQSADAVEVPTVSAASASLPDANAKNIAAQDNSAEMLKDTNIMEKAASEQLKANESSLNQASDSKKLDAQALAPFSQTAPHATVQTVPFSTRNTNGSAPTQPPYIALARIESAIRSPYENLWINVEELRLMGEEGATLAGRMEESLNRLGSILDNIDQVAQGELLKPCTDTVFSLSALVRKVYDKVHPLAEANAVTLSWFVSPSLPMYYVGNEHNIASAINFLVQSAVEAAESGAVQLTVRPSDVRPAPGEHERIMFSLMDSGMNMKALSRPSSIMSNTMQLVYSYQGSFNVEYLPGRGTAVNFSLVLEPAISAPYMQAAPAQGASALPHVAQTAAPQTAPEQTASAQKPTTEDEVLSLTDAQKMVPTDTMQTGSTQASFRQADAMQTGLNTQPGKQADFMPADGAAPAASNERPALNNAEPENTLQKPTGTQEHTSSEPLADGELDFIPLDTPIEELMAVKAPAFPHAPTDMPKGAADVLAAPSFEHAPMAPAAPNYESNAAGYTTEHAVQHTEQQNVQQSRQPWQPTAPVTPEYTAPQPSTPVAPAAASTAQTAPVASTAQVLSAASTTQVLTAPGAPTRHVNLADIDDEPWSAKTSQQHVSQFTESTLKDIEPLRAISEDAHIAKADMTETSPTQQRGSIFAGIAERGARFLRGKSAPQPVTRDKIVIADKSASGRRIITRRLEGLPYTLAEAGNARELANICADHRTGLIIIDAGMPETELKNGLQQANALESSCGYPPIPILCLLSHDSQREKMHRLGCTSCQVKTVSKVLFVDTVKAILSGSKDSIKPDEPYSGKTLMHTRDIGSSLNAANQNAYAPSAPYVQEEQTENSASKPMLDFIVESLQEEENNTRLASPEPAPTAPQGSAAQTSVGAHTSSGRLYLNGIQDESISRTKLPLIPKLIMTLQSNMALLSEGLISNDTTKIHLAAAALVKQGDRFELNRLTRMSVLVMDAAAARDLRTIADLSEDMRNICARYQLALQEAYDLHARTAAR